MHPRAERVASRALLSHALASLGMSLPWPLLLVLVWEQTHDGLWLGVAGAARMAPYVLFSWLAGRLADRCRRDVVIRLTLLARTGLLLALTAALAAGWTAGAVICAAIAVAVATPAFPALAAAVPSLLGDREAARARTTERLVTIEVTSFVVGPALGGLLLAPALRGWVPIAAVLCLAGALLAWRGVRLGPPEPAHTLSAHLSTVETGVVALVLHTPPVLAAVALAALVNALLAVVGVALLPLAEAWQAGSSTYGVALSVFGFGGLAAPVLARIGGHDPARVRRGMAGLGACVLALALSPAPAAAVLPLAVGGALAVVVESAATGLMQQHAPDRMRASVLGLTDTVMVAAALAGAFVAPVLADWVGARVLLISLGLLALASVPVASRALATGRPGGRHRPQGRPGQATLAA